MLSFVNDTFPRVHVKIKLSVTISSSTLQKSCIVDPRANAPSYVGEPVTDTLGIVTIIK